MATGFGSNCWLGFAEESTYGTPVSPTKFIEITEDNIQGKQSLISIPTLRSPSQAQRTLSKKSVEGSFKCSLGYSGFERLIKHALGTNNTTGPASSIYTHTCSLSTALPTGLTLHVNRDAAAVGAGSAFQYEGCQITKMTLRSSPETILEGEFEIVGENWTNENVATPTFPTMEPIDWTHLITCTFSGTTVNAKEIEYTIENNLATDRYKLGQRTRIGLGRNGPRKITMKVVCEFESLSQYQWFLNQTDRSAVVTFSNGQAGAAARVFSINATGNFQGDDPSVSDSGPIMFTMNFEAFDLTSSNTESSIVIQNATSTI